MYNLICDVSSYADVSVPALRTGVRPVSPIQQACERSIDGVNCF